MISGKHQYGGITQFGRQRLLYYAYFQRYIFQFSKRPERFCPTVDLLAERNFNIHISFYF
jgi:hypothetical protein